MPSENLPRSVLSNRTNAIWPQHVPPVECTLKRRVSTDRCGTKKRAKLHKTSANVHEDAVFNNDSTQKQVLRTGKGGSTTFSYLRSARMRPRGVIQNSSLSTRPILTKFVSSNKADVYNLHSEENPLGPGVPFACAFSADAKKGGMQILAVAMQEGMIELLNVSKREDWDPEPQSTKICTHKNAILDVKWGFGDQTLATASGDSTAKIISVTTHMPLATLAYHKSSVKTLDWDLSHAALLSTASRDGSICVWDLRTASHSDVGGQSPSLSPVVVIPHAHCDIIPRENAKMRSSSRTVTSLVYLPQNPQQLVSSGSFDGILKQWDLRYPVTGKARKPTLLSESWIDPTLESGCRSRGISSLALGRNHTAGIIWGLAANSHIHTYLMPLSAPFAHSAPHNRLIHPSLYVKSFHVKLATSPCGTWLASGSSGGGIYLWDVATRQPGPREAVELKTTEQEISAVDWANCSLAACCDDGTVRIWKPNYEVSSICRMDPEEKKWDWAWASDDAS